MGIGINLVLNNTTTYLSKALITDIESMEELAKATLFCVGCAKRVIIDSRQPGVRYCKSVLLTFLKMSVDY